jgi:hypothetical protein
MPKVQVTFPTDIPAKKVIELMETTIRTNEQGFTCKVKYMKKHRGEYLFEITTNKAQGFYFIGMTAHAIMNYISALKNHRAALEEKEEYTPIQIPEKENKTIYFKD